MTLYSCSQVSDLIESYINKGGCMYEISEGTLGYGEIILYDNNNKLKTVIIKERYINEWSSGHSIRMYQKTPKKYQKILEGV